MADVVRGSGTGYRLKAKTMPPSTPLNRHEACWIEAAAQHPG